MVEPSIWLQVANRWPQKRSRGACSGSLPPAVIAARPQRGVEPIVFQKGLAGKGIKKFGVELIQGGLIRRGVGNGPEGSEIGLELRGGRGVNLIEINVPVAS